MSWPVFKSSEAIGPTARLKPEPEKVMRSALQL